MFSVGYFNKAMVIKASNIKRINFQNVENLRRLVIQLLYSPCKKIVIDLSDIRFIDSMAFKVINRLHNLAEKQKVEFEFTNINPELLEIFKLIPATKKFRIIDSEVLYAKTDEEILI